MNHSPDSCSHGGGSDVVKENSPVSAAKFMCSFIPSAFLPEPVPAKDYITGDKWIE